MAKQNNTGKVIAVISGIALFGGYLLLKPKKQVMQQLPPDDGKGNTTTSTESGTMTPPPTLNQNTPKGSPTASKPLSENSGSGVANVYSTTNGAIVYKAIMNPDGSAKVGTKLRNADKGDKVGVFIGNRDISGYTFFLVKDVNSGANVLISKSVSKTAL